MARPSPPNTILSFLDLLLSAMGGVALLAVIFATMQTQNASATAPPLAGRYLVVEIADEASPLLVGRELGLYVDDGVEDLRYLGDDSEAGSAELRVDWPEHPARELVLRVRAEAGRELALGLWLRTAGPDPADVAGFLAAATDPAGVPVRVRWADASEDEAVTVTVALPEHHHVRLTLP